MHTLESFAVPPSFRERHAERLTEILKETQTSLGYVFDTWTRVELCMDIPELRLQIMNSDLSLDDEEELYACTVSLQNFFRKAVADLLQKDIATRMHMIERGLRYSQRNNFLTYACTWQPLNNSMVDHVREAYARFSLQHCETKLLPARMRQELPTLESFGLNGLLLHALTQDLSETNAMLSFTGTPQTAEEK